MVLNSHIARTIEGCSVGYAIVLRAIIATTYDILPLVVERSVGVAGLIGIAEPIPIVPVVHATSSKLEVTAGKLCAIIIILCRYTHVTLICQFKVLEISHNQWRFGNFDNQFNSRNTTENSTLRNRVKVGSTTCYF